MSRDCRTALRSRSSKSGSLGKQVARAMTPHPPSPTLRQSCAAIATALVVLATRVSGEHNATGTDAAVGGGTANTASGDYAWVGGGYQNNAEGNYTVIGGGHVNSIFERYGTVGGGHYNLVYAYAATVGGGRHNSASGGSSTIGGGYDNSVKKYFATVGGGQRNLVSGYSATVAGGQFNTVLHGMTVIGGGRENAVFNLYGTVGGGYYNLAYGYSSTIAGGHHNTLYGHYTNIGGGQYNTAYGEFATIAGGDSNVNEGDAGAVGGGRSNAVFSSNSSVVAGGFNNAVHSDWSCISGGRNNTLRGAGSAVGGGQENTVDAAYGTVGGGSSNSVLGDAATVAGGKANAVAGKWSAVGGGRNNDVDASYGSIGGGRFNSVNSSAPHATIGGGESNLVDGSGATISGGSNNEAYDNYVAIGGGRDNSVYAASSTIAGGYRNTAFNAVATVGGGQFNVVSGYASTVAGGQTNTVYSHYAAIGGGWYNTATGHSSTISGGLYNSAFKYKATVGGGYSNVALGYASTICGGQLNTVHTFYAAVGGGWSNHVFQQLGTVGGGYYNLVYGLAATISGGYANTLYGHYANIGGGQDNSAYGEFAVIAGGDSNVNEGDAGAVGGGRSNTVFSSNSSVVAGGFANAVQSGWSSIAGGHSNTVRGNWSSIGGGRGNVVLAGQAATVSGGELNAAHAAYATVSGGASNTASGKWSCVTGGTRNTAIGAASLAQGTGALAQHAAAAVLSFSMLNSTCESAGNSTITLCADNGVFLNGQQVLTVNDTSSTRATLAQHSLLLNASVQAISTVQRNVDHLRLNDSSLWEHVGILRADIDACNESSATLRDDLAANTAAFDTLENTVRAMNESATEQRKSLVSNEETVGQLRTTVESLQATVLDMNASLADKDLTIEHLEINVESMQRAALDVNTSLADKDLTIERLETTVESLLGTVRVMNASLASLTAVVEQMVKATTFASAPLTSTTLDGVDTTLVDCTSDAAGGAQTPCSQHRASNLTTAQTVTAVEEVTPAQESTNPANCGGLLQSPCTTTAADAATSTASFNTDGALTTFQHDVTAFPLPDVVVDACDTYPCGDDAASVDVFSWSSPVAVVVSVDATVEQFQFALLASSDSSVVWQQLGSSRFASFVPSDVGLTSAEEYQLHASALLEDGRTAEAVRSTALRFASPPALHGVAVEWINGSAAANWFHITVDATTDGTELRYEYFVGDTVAGWQYFAAADDNGTVVVVAPSTRNLTLHVTVTNAYGSSESCQECAALEPLATSTSNVSADDVTQDALRLVRSGLAGTSLLLAAIDVAGTDDGVGNSADENTAATLLASLSERVQAGETSLSQDVVVLDALVKAGAMAAGFADILFFVGARISDGAAATDASSLSLYLATVDTYGAALVSQDEALEGVAEMDEYLGSVCAASEAGSIPDGQISVFQQDSVSLSCASSEDIVAVDTGAATVLASVEGVSTVAVSTWNGTMNATNVTSFLSPIHGVHVEGARASGDMEEVETATTLKLSLSDPVAAVRKAATCVYYDEPTQRWSGRGVVLRGLELDGGSVVRAICASSHLTLFTVGDSSEAARIVESKIASFADRVDSMNNVNFLDDGTAINWSVMGVFVGITLLFATVIVVAKVKGRKAAVDRGRLTFQQDGQLSKPNVLGSRQYEAILRRWTSGRDTAKLVLLELLTGNAVLGMFFHWDHEAVVFGRADKAVILFGAVLMTFVSSAFLFDPNESVNGDLVVALWSALVTAVLTNALLLPVQHFLPYMVSNVNSLTTLTRMPTTLLKREMKRLSCWKTKKRATSSTSAPSTAVMRWSASLHEALKTPAAAMPRAAERVVRVSTKLHFLHCVVALPACVVVGKPNGSDLAKKKDVLHDGITRFQRLLRWRMRRKRDVRGVEFSAWYKGLRRERHALAMLSTSVLLVLAMFTLSICLLLSCAFNEEESAMWVVDVAQSLVVQIFVTDPAVTLLVIFIKLFVSWTILRIGKRRLWQHLQRQQGAVEEQIVAVAARVEVSEAKARALELVAGGVEAAVAREKAAKMAAKKKCNVALEGIAAAKAQLLQIRQTAARPRKAAVQEWDDRDAELSGRELSTRRSLRAIDAALEVLDGDRSSAEQQLLAAQQTIRELRQQLAKATQSKVSLSAKQAKVEDKPALPVVKKNAILPMAAAQRPEQQEPSADRTAMPVVQSAADLHGDASGVRRVATTASPTKSTSRRIRSRHARRSRKVSVVAARGSGSSGGSSGGGNGGSSDGFSHAVTVATKARGARRRVPGIEAVLAARPRRAMTWAEIRAMQQALRDQAAKAPQKSLAVRPRRRRGSLGKLSPSSMKVLLQRRERRRKWLERRAAAHSEEPGET